jgi:ribosome-associated protein
VTRDALVVTSSLSIPRAELMFRASRAGGAGGQHVNTSSTRIELLWDLTRSASVTDDQRERLLSKLAARLDAEGFVRVVASARRSQQQNREEAEQRLAQLVRQALVVPKTRKKTKPGRAAKEKRLSEKRRHAERKQNRRQRDFD